MKERKIKKPREVQDPAQDLAVLLQGRLGREEQPDLCHRQSTEAAPE